MTQLSSRNQIVQECLERIQKGSKSFSLAAKLYPPDVRVRAFLLYAWCRFCDDAIDEAPNLEARSRRLEELFRKTEDALAGAPDREIAFQALAIVARESELPSRYPAELLEGMAMDLRGERYLTESDLERYCFRVAGVVGLQMTYAMGVRDPRAFPHAVALGNAMQMTNIARDVADDLAMGRVYLPLAWLADANVRPEDLLSKSSLPRTTEVVRRLLDAAEKRYAVGIDGLKYLPWRCALAVAVAGCVYREIGRKVRDRRVHAWDTRTVVSKPRKLWCVFQGLKLVLARLPERWQLNQKSARETGKLNLSMIKKVGGECMAS